MGLQSGGHFNNQNDAIVYGLVNDIEMREIR